MTEDISTWVIYDKDTGLFWSDGDCWVDFKLASRYDVNPESWLPKGGAWIPVDEVATYRVDVREVYIQPTYVVAVSEDDAIKRVVEGAGDVDESEMEYSHPLDPDTWTVKTAVNRRADQ